MDTGEGINHARGPHLRAGPPSNRESCLQRFALTPGCCGDKFWTSPLVEIEDEGGRVGRNLRHGSLRVSRDPPFGRCVRCDPVAGSPIPIPGFPAPRHRKVDQGKTQAKSMARDVPTSRFVASRFDLTSGAPVAGWMSLATPSHHLVTLRVEADGSVCRESTRTMRPSIILGLDNFDITN